MLRFVLLAALAALPFAALAQVSDDRLGLSRAEILKMGDEKWFSYYEAKRGDSPEALTTECNTYAHALHEQNLERLHSLKASDRLQRWMAEVVTYGNATFKIQSRNGDPAWKPVYAAQGVDMEELLDHLINLEVHPDKASPPSLPAAVDRVRKHHDEIGHRLFAVPVYPDRGLTRQMVMDANQEASNALDILAKDVLKTGGQEAFVVIVACSHLSDPEVLFGSE